MTGRSRTSLFALLLVMLLILWVSGLTWFISLIPTASPAGHPKADAIVVLTGDKKRLEYGFTLFKEGRAASMLISGVGSGMSLHDLLSLDKESMAENKGQENYPGISLGYHANSTATNATETQGWMEKNGYHSLLLVTSNYHMPRALMEFSRLMPDVTVYPEPVFPTDFAEGTWWKQRYALLLILSEYHKFLAVWLHLKPVLPDKM